MLRPLLLCLLATCAAFAAAKVEDPRPKLDACLHDWLTRANLDPLPVPDFGKDPRASEQWQITDVQKMNRGLSEARKARAAEHPSALVEQFPGLIGEVLLAQDYRESHGLNPPQTGPADSPSAKK